MSAAPASLRPRGAVTPWQANAFQLLINGTPTSVSKIGPVTVTRPVSCSPDGTGGFFCTLGGDTDVGNLAITAMAETSTATDLVGWRDTNLGSIVPDERNGTLEYRSRPGLSDVLFRLDLSNLGVIRADRETVDGTSAEVMAEAYVEAARFNCVPACAP